MPKKNATATIVRTIRVDNTSIPGKITVIINEDTPSTRKTFSFGASDISLLQYIMISQSMLFAEKVVAFYFVDDSWMGFDAGSDKQ